MKKIVVVEVNDILAFPPVRNLVICLLNNSYTVTLIGENAKEISKDLKANTYLKVYDIGKPYDQNNMLKRIIGKIKRRVLVRKLTKTCMEDADILWTTSANTIKELGKLVLRYKNVLQLMELTKDGYLFRNIIKFPLGEIAAASWKTVVPEINRAYIQKVWWGLSRKPYVLPNKPYSLEYGEITDDMTEGIAKLKNETRKILLYLGGIWPDRDLNTFADAVDKLGDKYCLCIIGKPYGKEAEDALQELIKRNSVIYLGSYKAPKHLAFVKYAYIGLLPYRPTFGTGVSELNALYCAPNKIYEYAGFNVPMLGSDVLGLKVEFEKYNIGICCDMQNISDIINGIKQIEENYDTMKHNCRAFYDRVDLDAIVNEILSENCK